MLAIQMRSSSEAHEELRAIASRTRVSHGHNTTPSVSVDEVFISKLGSVNTLATSSIVVGEISTLSHELGDDSMEDGILEV